MQISALVLLLCFFMVFNASPSEAMNQSNVGDLFDMDLEELMSVKVTTLATRTSMDAVHAPGIVLILQGEALQRSGARTIIEALDRVAGMYITDDWTAVVRGVGDTWNTGKILYQLNGMTMSESATQEMAPYLLPIELVQRIEVIRGPGAALYGKSAVLAVINVITKTEGSLLFAETGSFDLIRAGGLLSAKKNDLQVSLALTGYQRDRTEQSLQRDAFSGTALTRAPGPVDDAKADPLSAILNLSWKDFTLKGSLLSYDNHHVVGMTGSLPPVTNGPVQNYRQGIMELLYDTSGAASAIDVIARIGVREYLMSYHQNYHLMPPGFSGLANGITGGPHYRERVTYGGTDLLFSPLAGHDALIGVEYEFSKITEAWSATNFDSTAGLAIPQGTRLEGAKNWINPDARRAIVSLYAQDVYTPFSGLTLTLGARYDEMSDTENHLSPRLAVVRDFNHRHVLKAQYAEAFRPPTFIEMYMKNNPLGINGNRHLKPENGKTLEAGYTYINPLYSLGVTVFDSRLEDMIDVRNNLYQNVGTARTKGFELEAEYRTAAKVAVSADLAYADAYDKRTGTPLPGSADWLASMEVRYRPSSRLTLSAFERYQGRTHRVASDSRGALKPQSTLALSLSFEDAFASGLRISAGVENVFDCATPSPVANTGADLPGKGRTWWTAVVRAF